MKKFNIAKLTAQAAVQSVATTIIIGKAIANAGSSFAKEVSAEVEARQEIEKEIQNILEPTQPNQSSSMRDFANKGDVEC